MRYSKKLIGEFKRVFREEYGKIYTDQEADVALDNLAGLFLAFKKVKQSENKNLSET